MRTSRTQLIGFLGLALTGCYGHHTVEEADFAPLTSPSIGADDEDAGAGFEDSGDDVNGGDDEMGSDEDAGAAAPGIPGLDCSKAGSDPLLAGICSLTGGGAGSDTGNGATGCTGTDALS